MAAKALSARPSSAARPGRRARIIDLKSYSLNSLRMWGRRWLDGLSFEDQPGRIPLALHLAGIDGIEAQARPGAMRSRDPALLHAQPGQTVVILLAEGCLAVPDQPELDASAVRGGVGFDHIFPLMYQV